ncbi:leucine rich repeat-containing protein [Besnoitia besnoiti]|uniref:Leucine rich repeat-containing protein n=1 Tax=Besnoitia besnoiti TaxID=94643 RepID=A0A2A9MI14_BESBE|nr:leucine rich repeat-containing protein [Besnoitia besnoiti]PFH35596.1 leucine rich repeat-containing protein [Besnoitia besnoiti]
MAPTVLSASNASSDGSGSRYQGNAVRVPERRSGFAPQFFDLRADDSVQDHLNSPSATPDIYDVDWQNTHSPHALPSEAAEDNDLGQGFPSSSEGLGTTTVEDDESGTNALLSNISMLTTDTVSMEALLASPRIFSCMTKLTVISYEGLQLQGRDLASLGCIPSLRQLKLRKCGIKNLDFLVSFVGRSPVEEVDVAANDISSLPPRSSFARATLPRCFGQLTDWSHMAEQRMEKFPSSLRTLDLSYNRITDMRSLEALAEFPNLHVVRLNGNDMSKCLETDASLARNLAEWPRCRSKSRLSHAGDDGCLTSEVVSPTDKTNRHRSTELQTALQKIVCENETLYEQLQAARLALAAGQETSASGAERSPRTSGAAGAVIKRDTQREHHARTWAIPRLLPATRSLQGETERVRDSHGRSLRNTGQLDAASNGYSVIAAHPEDTSAEEQTPALLPRLDRARRAFINGLYRVGEADEASSLYYWTAAAMTQLENMRLILPPVQIPGATPETNRVLQTLLRLHYLEKLLIRRFLEEAHQYLRSAAALADAQRRLHAIDAEISSVVSAVKYFGGAPSPRHSPGSVSEQKIGKSAFKPNRSKSLAR